MRGHIPEYVGVLRGQSEGQLLLTRPHWSHQHLASRYANTAKLKLPSDKNIIFISDFLNESGINWCFPKADKRAINTLNISNNALG